MIARFEDLMNIKSVIESGSINAAARSIGCSQSALTRSVSRLEASLGVRLVNRSARGIVPTAYGHALMTHLKALNQELQRTAITLDSLKGATQGEVTCGGTISPLSGLVPLAADQLQRARPNLRVRVVEGIPAQLLSMLRLGEIDVVVAAKFDNVREKDLTEEVIGNDQIGIFARYDHPVFDRSIRSLAELLASERWILPGAGSNLYNTIQKSFSGWDLEMPSKALYTSSAMVLRKLITECQYLAITTSQTVAQDVKNGSVRVVHGDWQLPLSHTVIYQRANEAVAPAVHAFVQCLRNVAAVSPIVPLISKTIKSGRRGSR